MKILIVGGDGMLGHQLFDHFQDKHDTRVTLRGSETDYEHLPQYSAANAYYNVNVRDFQTLENICASFRPDTVINAVAIVKQRVEAADYIQSIEVNSLFPHLLAKTCEGIGAKAINLATDCVFSGLKGNYSEDDIPDPVDLYGRSKLLGEVIAGNSLTLRTSIIGLELNRKMGLVEWFLSQKGTIKGYKRAIYSGLTTLEISRVIENLMLNRADLSGLWHVASRPIDKYSLLCTLSESLGRDDIQIEEDEEFSCDRSLCADRFNKEVQYAPPEWDTMIDELAIQIKRRQEHV